MIFSTLGLKFLEFLYSASSKKMGTNSPKQQPRKSEGQEVWVPKVERRLPAKHLEYNRHFTGRRLSTFGTHTTLVGPHFFLGCCFALFVLLLILLLVVAFLVACVPVEACFCCCFWATDRRTRTFFQLIGTPFTSTNGLLNLLVSHRKST